MSQVNCIKSTEYKNLLLAVKREIKKNYPSEQKVKIKELYKDAIQLGEMYLSLSEEAKSRVSLKDTVQILEKFFQNVIHKNETKTEEFISSSKQIQNELRKLKNE